ncbi:hypothetical protein OIU85_000607 [Salix viminalis]|uniref:Uncharacterized protein n=1 Tax=Salix viminalis TaxID=40686 RepID=A0A9Q0ZXB9_SALVM|nr:hypothetical protein OIU85_000607 [Salix viminalis]
MKVRVVCRKVYDYIRYDLREIAFPSSLPDPPHIQNRPKLTWRDNLFILKKATRLYCASWVRDIGPDLRPNDYTKDNEANGEAKTTSSAPEKEPSVIEDLAVAARGGMETLRPALQRVYLTRASAYRDALQSFIQGHEHNPWSFATTSLLKSCNPSERIFSCCRLYVFYLLSAWKLFKALFWPFNLLLSPNRLKHWRVLKELLKLKKEAEFLEASFRAKAALLQQGEDESSLQSSISEQKQYLKGNGRKSADVRLDRSKSKFQGLWNFLVYSPTMKPGPDVAVVDASLFLLKCCIQREKLRHWQGDADIGQTTTSMGIGESESNEIRRFELLRNELMELEKRVQKSTDQYENEEDIKVTDDDANYHDEAASSQLIHVPRNENIIRKSIAKLKKKQGCVARDSASRY